MPSPIELHGAQTGNCLRVSVAFEEAGIPYVVRRLDMRSGEHRGAGHLALNPAGKVPTIIDRSRPDRPLVLSQSNAIIFHAVALAPGRLIAEAEGAERALTLERFFYFITDVVAVSHASFAMRAEDLGPARAFLDARAATALAFAERFVAASPFMAGDHFTMADIAALTIALSLKSQLDWTALPNLDRWLDAVTARPAVQRGLAAFDDAPV